MRAGEGRPKHRHHIYHHWQTGGDAKAGAATKQRERGRNPVVWQWIDSKKRGRSLMHANWWHQRKLSSSGKVMWFALRWPKATSVWRSYLLSLISVAFPADRERCIRRQKGARWGEGSVLVCKNGGVRHTNRPKASGKTDDFGTSSCIVCYSVTGHKWPENKILARLMSAPPPPPTPHHHLKLDPLTQSKQTFLTFVLKRTLGFLLFNKHF